MGLFALATVLFLPGAIFGLIGGALFGPVWGSAWNVAGATLGATLAFLTARYVASDWVARRAGGRLKGLIEGVEAEGWRFVAMVRLVPLFPFNLLNYALALTRIRLSQYVVASAVAMIPGTVASTWLGHAGREVAAGSETAIRNVLLALGLLAVVAFAATADPAVSAQRAAVDRRTAIADPTRSGRAVAGDRRSCAGRIRRAAGACPCGDHTPCLNSARALVSSAASKRRSIAIVCRTDKRSAKAAELLIEASFADVTIVRGGMEHWQREGFVVAGATTG